VTLTSKDLDGLEVVRVTLAKGNGHGLVTNRSVLCRVQVRILVDTYAIKTVGSILDGNSSVGLDRGRRRSESEAIRLRGGKRCDSGERNGLEEAHF